MLLKNVISLNKSSLNGLNKNGDFVVETVALTNQWNDFLVRQYDPYALAKYEILLDWMGDVADKSVLVVGCGSGEFCAMLAQRGANVNAIDIDEAPIDLTAKTAAKFGVKIKTWVAQIETISLDEQYDLVVATDVIEHIKDDSGAMARLQALTKFDGHMVVTVPALQRLFGYHDEILGHFRRYSSKSLTGLLGENFEISKMRYFGFFLIPVTVAVSCILRRPYPMIAIENVKKQNTFFRRALSALFQTEKLLHFGVGTSLLLMARPKKR